MPIKVLGRLCEYILKFFLSILALSKHISKLEIAGSYPSIETLERIASVLGVEIKEFFNFDGLKDANYVRDELKKLLKYSDEKHLQLLYKIHNDIINM